MHILEKHSGDQARAKAGESAPFGPGFAEDIVSKTETYEVWGSSINDPGDDFCEFRAMDTSGAVIAQRRVAGY